jgi:hypothetical protein
VLLLLLLLLLLHDMQLSNLKRDVAESADSGVSWQVIGSGVSMGSFNAADVETAAQQQGLLAQTLVEVSCCWGDRSSMICC